MVEIFSFSHPEMTHLIVCEGGSRCISEDQSTFTVCYPIAGLVVNIKIFLERDWSIAQGDWGEVTKPHSAPPMRFLHYPRDLRVSCDSLVEVGSSAFVHSDKVEVRHTAQTTDLQGIILKICRESSFNFW